MWKTIAATAVVALGWIAGALAASEEMAKPMVEAHNAVRRAHDLPPLRWSRALADHAAAWADHLAVAEECTMRHATQQGEGENLFWASPVAWSDGRREIQAISAADVVNSWAAEEADYDYASNSCDEDKACGHYTQIVWKKTTEVGCASRVCPDAGQIWVCRYAPPGNWIGQRPY